MMMKMMMVKVMKMVVVMVIVYLPNGQLHVIATTGTLNLKI